MAETVRVLVEEEEVDKEDSVILESRSVKIMKEKKCISSVY